MYSDIAPRRMRGIQEMIDVASLRFDVIFKKAFSLPEVFTQFVRDVLGISIHVDRVIQDYRYPEPIGFVDIVYDLFAEDVENRVIVEIQHVKEIDFFDRFLYYHLIGIIQQVKSYTDYRFPKTVYTVVVVTGDTRSRNEHVTRFGVATSQMEAFNEFNQPLGIYPHRLVFLNPRNINERTPENIRAWLELIDDSLDEQVDETRYDSPLLQQVIEEIKKDNVTPQELSRIKDEAVLERYFRESFEDGHKEGHEKGREEGHEEGRKTREREIARSMLARGVDVVLVAEVTGLSQEEIENLNG